jgi:hypothetical protein
MQIKWINSGNQAFSFTTESVPKISKVLQERYPAR